MSLRDGMGVLVCHCASKRDISKQHFGIFWPWNFEGICQYWSRRAWLPGHSSLDCSIKSFQVDLASNPLLRLDRRWHSRKAALPLRNQAASKNPRTIERHRGTEYWSRVVWKFLQALGQYSERPHARPQTSQKAKIIYIYIHTYNIHTLITLHYIIYINHLPLPTITLPLHYHYIPLHSIPLHTCIYNIQIVHSVQSKMNLHGFFMARHKHRYVYQRALPHHLAQQLEPAAPRDAVVWSQPISVAVWWHSMHWISLGPSMNLVGLPGQRWISCIYYICIHLLSP